MSKEVTREEMAEEIYRLIIYSKDQDKTKIYIAIRALIEEHEKLKGIIEKLSIENYKLKEGGDEW